MEGIHFELVNFVGICVLHKEKDIKISHEA